MIRLARSLVGPAVMFALVGLPLAHPALGAIPTGNDEIDRFVEDQMEASGLPGISYAIVRDGETVHAAAFGSADSTGRAMTTDTPVVIGSVGKTMTALAIRQLAAAGKLDIDAPVQRYLPWFMLADASVAARITVRQLLDHTSGLSRADGQRPDMFAPGLTPERVVRELRDVAPGREPGTFEYSNLNYIVLGVIVEAVSGQSYADYLDEHVFAPLGMTHSYAALDAAKRGGLAEGHRYLFGLPVAWEEPYPTAIVPAGYQISSASDMARYVAAFSDHGRYRGVDIAGPTSGDLDYGIDWVPVSGVGYGFTPGHSGATLNSNAGLIYMPVAHLGVVVLTNANPTELWIGSPRGASEIAFDILRFTLGEEALTGGPTVREAYLVADGALLLLGALTVFEVLRLRGWTGRTRRSDHPRRGLVRDGIVDWVVPLLILVGLPLWVGVAGITRPFDVLGTWRVAMWTLPDLGATLIAASLTLIAVGVAKIVLLAPGGPSQAGIDGASGQAGGPTDGRSESSQRAAPS